METPPGLPGTPRGEMKSYGRSPFCADGRQPSTSSPKRENHALFKTGRGPGFPLYPTFWKVSLPFPGPGEPRGLHLLRPKDVP